MKKYLIFVAVLTLVLVPVFSHAYTIAELQALISRLQAQLTAMQNQSTSDCPYTRNLAYGDGVGNGLGSQVRLLQNWLRASNYLNIPSSTGHFGSLTQIALRRWQKDNGLTVTGRISASERLALCGRNNSSTNISITSVSGPTSLNVNQTGTWSLNVTAPTETNLTYSVDWGEVMNMTTGAGSIKVNQGSTFTHSYSQAGTYTVKFKVSGGGWACATTLGCSQKYNDETSLTVVVGGGTSQNLSITYPADPANWHDFTGENFSKVFTVRREVSPTKPPYYTWSVTSGALPPGLQLISRAVACSQNSCVVDSYGDCLACGGNYSNQIIIGGTPTRAGNFPFTLNVRDNYGNTGSINLNINIENAVVCTADAYRCPSGSYVGRTAPSCEFICP